MSNKTYIMWYWRYHALDFSIHDNLDDAINDARWGSDHGELAFDSIEVFEDGVGTVLDRDEVMARWREMERAEEDEYEAKQAAAPVSTAVICLLTPEGKHGGILDYIYGNTAEDKYKLERYEQTFGQRIKVEALS